MYSISHQKNAGEIEEDKSEKKTLLRGKCTGIPPFSHGGTPHKVFLNTSLSEPQTSTWSSTVTLTLCLLKLTKLDSTNGILIVLIVE